MSGEEPVAAIFCNRCGYALTPREYHSPEHTCLIQTREEHAAQREKHAAQRVERAAQEMEDVWRTHAKLGTRASPIDHCRSLARALDDAGMLTDPDDG